MGSLVRTASRLPPHVLLATAVWYAVAEAYGLEPDGSYAATTLDAAVMADMLRLLESARVSPQNIALILGKVGAGLKYLALHPYTQLDELTYRDVYQHLPAESPRRGARFVCMAALLREHS